MTSKQKEKEIKGRVFVMGDIHGAHKALVQCLERSNFDKDLDTLIQLGDVVDGWPESPEVIEELLSLKNIVQIKGNHDQWFHDWMQSGARPLIWTQQGGQATIDAYLRCPELMVKHRDYFKDAGVFIVGEDNRAFCHGGFNPKYPVIEQREEDIMWDRTLADKTVHENKKGFEVKKYHEVYLGHTSVNSFPAKMVEKNKPFNGGNVWLMDTGAGWEGVLTIMDVDTKEIHQSDLVSDLYPNLGRVWYKG